MQKIDKAFEEWKKRTENNKIKAICKPCWELNYCPYGVLVEDFQLTDEYDYECRIFGHECPVFTVAEPFTETKQLRNIDRQIPHQVKLIVYSRDKQICQLCNKNIPYDEIQYDHIIPWSKGGSSNHQNIRLVCSDCNKKRGNNYEDDFLIGRVGEHTNKFMTLSLQMLEDLLRLMIVWIDYEKSNGCVPNMDEYVKIIQGVDKETDEFMYMIIQSLYTLLKGEFLNVKKKMNILRYRWGFIDSVSHSIEETCMKFKVDTDYIIKCEALLLNRLCFQLNKKDLITDDYLNLKVKDDYYELLDK